jgi:hypothetical protein
MSDVAIFGILGYGIVVGSNNNKEHSPVMSAATGPIYSQSYALFYDYADNSSWKVDQQKLRRRILIRETIYKVSAGESAAYLSKKTFEKSGTTFTFNIFLIFSVKDYGSLIVKPPAPPASVNPVSFISGCD